MKITYVEHSCFLVELEQAYLLFDYFTGAVHLPELDNRRKIFVFNSHSHGDHFSENIFSALKKYSGVHYFLDSDIAVPQEVDIRFTLVEPHQVYSLPGTDWQVTTLASNDEGVAFSASVSEEGTEVSLFHAGDLNNWWWDGDAEDERLQDFYRRELQQIAGKHYLAAFLPLDPRLQGWWKGIDDFMKTATADYIFPMHNFGDYRMPPKMKKLKLAAGYADRIMDVKEPLQTWVIPASVHI